MHGSRHYALQRALWVREKESGPDHPATAYALVDLAKALHHDGDLRAAEPMYARAADIFERHLGGDHPVLWPLNRVLCRLRRRLGDSDGARVAGERMLEGFAPGTVPAMWRMIELAAVLVTSGAREEALELHRAALAIHRANFPADELSERLTRWIRKAELAVLPSETPGRGRKKRGHRSRK